MVRVMGGGQAGKSLRWRHRGSHCSPGPTGLPQPNHCPESKQASSPVIAHLIPLIAYEEQVACLWVPPQAACVANACGGQAGGRRVGRGQARRITQAAGSAANQLQEQPASVGALAFRVSTNTLIPHSPPTHPPTRCKHLRPAAVQVHSVNGAVGRLANPDVEGCCHCPVQLAVCWTNDQAAVAVAALRRQYGRVCRHDCRPEQRGVAACQCCCISTVVAGYAVDLCAFANGGSGGVDIEASGQATAPIYHQPSRRCRLAQLSCNLETLQQHVQQRCTGRPSGDRKQCRWEC